MTIYVCHGLNTSKVYAEGTKSEIHRHLSNKYPNYIRRRTREDTYKEITIKYVLPEPMKIVREEDYHGPFFDEI